MGRKEELASSIKYHTDRGYVPPSIDHPTTEGEELITTPEEIVEQVEPTTLSTIYPEEESQLEEYEIDEIEVPSEGTIIGAGGVPVSVQEMNGTSGQTNYSTQGGSTRYPYTFKEILNLSGEFGEDILQQPWVETNNNTTRLIDAFSADLRYKDSSFFDLSEFQEKLQEINDVVKKQNIFYTNRNGQPTKNGPTNKTRLEEAHDMTGDYKDIKSEINSDPIKTAIVLYNDNLEKAISHLYCRKMREALENYNSNPIYERVREGTDKDGNEIYKNYPLYLNCDTSDCDTFEALGNCEMRSKILWLAKIKGRLLCDFEVPVRNANTR